MIELKNVFEDEGIRLPLEASVDFSGVLDNGVCHFITPVKVSGEFVNRIGMVSLKATARFTYSAPCDRCAEETLRDFEVPIEHNLVTKLNDENNDNFLVVENMKLDVDELVRCDVLLSMPSKYLCKEDCRGLCSQCGANLNVSPCKCVREADPRMAKLLTLLDDDE